MSADKHHWESQFEKYGYDYEDDDEFYVIGDRVYVDKYRPGSVAYFGDVEFASGDWVGVVLDSPTGNHDGKIHGREYFQCAPFHGIFVRPHRVSRMSDSALGSSATGSRAATPLPTFQRLHTGQVIKSPGSSTMGSYYYDDDYRQDRVPSVASLTSKLKSINEQQKPTDDTYYKYSRTSSGGILKGGQQMAGTNLIRSQSSVGARAEELSRRIRASSSSPSQMSTVFNFRPKREQLNEYISQNNSTSGRQSSVNLTSEPPRKGDRVVVRTERGEMTGILRFMGETYFATGEWAGIELDDHEGKNDGSVLGYRYFYCPKNYGLFVPATRVRKFDSFEQKSSTASGRLATNEPVFSGMRSTITSPPPSYCHSRSTTPSRDLASSSLSMASTSPHSGIKRNDTPGSTYSSSTTGYLSQSNSRFANDSLKMPLSTNTSSLNAQLSYADEEYKLDYCNERPKFDDRDIEIQLKKSLQEPISYHAKITSGNIEPARPKAVKYTFTSSKYDGNPIARRTLFYE